MVRRKFLRLASALALGILIAVSSAVATYAELLPDEKVPCLDAVKQTTGCPGVSASTGDGAVDLSAGGSSGGGRGGESAPPLTKSQMNAAQRDAYEAERRRYAEENGLPYREEFWITSTGEPVVTLADIASFRPVVGSDRMEPNGWMVVGLDTNFYSDATRHEVAGTLIGYPANVRFTPKVWHWTYGDGQSRSSSRPGASWAALGVAEFEPTATSHVYAGPGTFTIDLAIEFAAEYRFIGPGWSPIAGTLTVPVNRIVATAGDAKTVLVSRDCAANPGGAGC